MKRSLLIILLLFSLNFSFQPGVNLLNREKHFIVNMVNTENNKYTGNFLSLNKKIKIKYFVALKICVMNADRILPENHDSS